MESQASLERGRQERESQRMRYDDGIRGWSDVGP